MANLETVNVTLNAGDESPEAVAARAAADAAAIKVADDDGVVINGVKPEVKPVDDGVAKRPESIPEKFWNAETGTVNTEAMIKEEEYLKEKNAGEPKPKTKDAGSEGDDDESGDKPADDQSNAVADASAEWAEKGELSDGTYDNLAKQGLSRDMVNAYIDGQNAVVGKLQEAAWGQFEGEENYSKATAWARENMSKDDIATLDIQLGSDNPAIVAAGAKALNAVYSADVDITPDNTIIGDNGGTVTGSYFKSSAEMQAAMSDPKYKKDPAFRAEVASKIERAELANVNLF